MNWRIFTFGLLAQRHRVKAVRHDLMKLKLRLAGMAEDDPLWPLLLGLLEAEKNLAVEGCVLPGLADEESHRMRGRVGALLDFRESLEKVWNETHPRRSAEGGVRSAES